MVRDFKFHDRLLLEWPLDGKNQFILIEPFRVSFILDDVPISWTVQRGSKTDLASIPRIVPKWCARKIDRHIPAAVVHDDFCVCRPWTSQVAADVFNEAMRTLGVNDWDRWKMYQSVARFGPRW